MSDVTRILSRIEQGDPTAAEQLLPLVYEELRQLAAAWMAQESSDHTLQATALVHEAYIRLVDVDLVQRWNSRGHFFGAAAEAMRRILIEAARRRKQEKHGGDKRRVRLTGLDQDASPRIDDVLELDEALEKLAGEDGEAAELVKLKVFGGMTVEELASHFGVSPRTVKRTWAYARAWLRRSVAVVDESPKDN